MRTFSFENLLSWQQSRELVCEVYKLTNSFPKSEMYGFTSQIRRAALSISSNLAEGSGREKPLDQRRFYNMAFSSLMEVINQLILANDLNYLSEKQLTAIRPKIDALGLLITKLAKSRDIEGL